MLDQVEKNINNSIEGAIVQPSYYRENDKLIVTSGKAGLKVEKEKFLQKIYEVVKKGEEQEIEIPIITSEPDEINIEQIYQEVYKQVQDAYYIKEPFTIYPEVEGVDFDLENAKLLLQEQKEEYEIPLVITKPNKTTRDIGTEASPDLLATFSTNYAIPTYNTIKLTAASDSLITKNKYVQDINKDIWAANGYVNALITINYQQNKAFSMNTYYSAEDIDVANNTLNLNLYYNSNSENPNAQGQSVFSFRLPEEVIYSNGFSTDSITLVLNAISGYDNSQLNKVGECKVALKDFSEPRF